MKPDRCVPLRAARRPASRWALLLSALVGLVLVVGQLSVALHFVLVPHRFCALHGLEHIGANHEPAQDSARTTGVRPSISLTAPSEAAHDVCVLAARVHERLAYLAPSTHEICAPAAVRASTRGSDGARRSSRIWLDYAPKIGPPA